MSLQTKRDLHLERKLFHTFGVMVMFVGLQVLPEAASWSLLIGGLVSTVLVDFFRLRHPKVNTVVVAVMRPFIRKDEYSSYCAVTFLLIGVTLARWMFSHHVVSVALLFLAFGDPLASAFGILYGKRKLIDQKSDAGFLAAFVASALSLLAYHSYFDLFSSSVGWICLLGGLIGALSELVPFGPLDDNLSQPLISGTLLTALFYSIEIL